MSKRQRAKFKKSSSVVIALLLMFAAAYIYGKDALKDNNASKDNPQQESSVSDNANAKDIAEFNFIDVGQGDCTLIKSPSGKFMLIDAGTTAASQKILDYLGDCGVSELEYLILTHPHEDHIGSADKVIENFKVKNVLMNSLEATTAVYERTVDALLESKEKNGTKVTEPEVGDIFDFDGISLEILSDGKGQTDANNSSIVTRITYGECSFMFTGDAEKEIEQNILSQNKDISCVLLKCGHHGSSTSSTGAFVDAVSPKIAIISCGLDNSYGHPSVETLKKLGETNVQIYRTDEDGDIAIGCDGRDAFLLDTSNDIKMAASEGVAFAVISINWNLRRKRRCSFRG